MNNKNIHLLIETDNWIKEQVKTTKKMKATIYVAQGCKEERDSRCICEMDNKSSLESCCCAIRSKISADLFCNLLYADTVNVHQTIKYPYTNPKLITNHIPWVRCCFAPALTMNQHQFYMHPTLNSSSNNNIIIM